jgi:hypothetical protein
MILFTCTQCGKALEQSDSSAGVVIFCECGQGNLVPWESARGATVKSPPTADPLTLQAVPIGEEELPVVQPAAVPQQRDSKNCFNHQDRPSEQKCSDCGEGFCNDCLVRFQGTVLCGPCKNFRLRSTSRPFTTSGKAVLGVMLAICCAPLAMCLLPAGVNDFSLALGALALIGETIAIMLGGLALRDTERDTHLHGKWLAITTILTGGLASVVTISFLLIR